VNMSEPTRAYLYRTGIALGGVAMVYGWASGEEIAVWLGLASAVLNIMPAANTSTDSRAVPPAAR
jgi:hypothetical protein